MAGGLREIISDTSYLLDEIGSGNFTATTKVEERYIGDFHEMLLAMKKITKNLSSTLAQMLKGFVHKFRLESARGETDVAMLES